MTFKTRFRSKGDERGKIRSYKYFKLVKSNYIQRTSFVIAWFVHWQLHDICMILFLTAWYMHDTAPNSSDLPWRRASHLFYVTSWYDPCLYNYMHDVLYLKIWCRYTIHLKLPAFVYIYWYMYIRGIQCRYKC